jgi:TRAP-type transport system periplasmic protein
LALTVTVAEMPAAMAQSSQPEFKFKLMGVNRTQDQFKLFQEWGKTIEKRSNGRVQIEFTSLPELGMGGGETLRVLRTGIVDMAEVYSGFVAGELPIIEILEMPGLLPDPATAKKAVLAWKPREAALMDQKVNAELLCVGLLPDQAIFSRKPLRTLADFKGQKIRVNGVAMASLVAGLGAQPLTVPFADMYPSLERGALDAGITGTSPGLGLRLYEVSKYLVGPIAMRPHLNLSINKAAWKRLPPDLQKMLKEEAERVIETRSFTAVEEWNQDGMNKNLERGMQHMPFSPEMMASVKEILRSKVVPEWVKRSGGAEAAKAFNEVIAPLVGFTVSP